MHFFFCSGRLQRLIKKDAFQRQPLSFCKGYGRATFFFHHGNPQHPPPPSETETTTTTTTNIEIENNKKQQPQQRYVLAQMNYARLLAPLDDPSMEEFNLALDPINRIAKSTPGFVWSFDNDDDTVRNQVERLRDDPLLMPQLSCWADMASLKHFVFKSGHAMYFKRKRDWFTPPPIPYAVCWWHDFKTNHYNPPTLKEAFERCDYLRDNGPSLYAFDFATAKDYPMPNDDDDNNNNDT